MKGNNPLRTYVDDKTVAWVNKYVKSNDIDVAKLIRKLLSKLIEEEKLKK